MLGGLRVQWTEAEKKLSVHTAPGRAEDQRRQEAEQKQINDNSLKANKALKELSEFEEYAELEIEQEVEAAVSQLESLVAQKLTENILLQKVVLSSRR